MSRASESFKPFLKLSVLAEVYLDHAGATIYSELQISNFMKDLSCHTYGNPHSDNAASQRTFEVVEEVRRKSVLFCSTFVFKNKSTTI